ncbi:MAG: tRNA pseudouridine(55) synthase [Myxococcales bacterium]
MRPGIHLLHKRPGETSFSLVRAFAERTGLRACHGGALDPFAEGLLLLLAGPATRLFELLHPIPKTYEAEIAWGVETDNGDPLGRSVATGDASSLTPAQLDSAVSQHLGWRDQVPPATSNKRVNGERAYLRAHRGEEFVLPASRVYLHEARFLQHDLPRASRLRLVVRGGYYVRALVRDLGRDLGCRAHLSALRRISIGPWSDPAGDPEIVSGAAVLPWAPRRELTDEEERRIRGGAPIPRGDLAAPEWLCPPEFPDPAAPVRAIHRGRLEALLRESPDGFVRAMDLRGL